MAAEERHEAAHGRTQAQARAEDKAEDGEIVNEEMKRKLWGWRVLMGVSAGALAFIAAAVGIGALLGWMEKTVCDDEDVLSPGPSLFWSMEQERDG
jgi:hypothetical protein